MTKQPKSDNAQKTPKLDKKSEQILGLTNDLQRVRADFENYRKRVELEKETARKAGARKTVLDLLPVIDNIGRAIDHIPEEITEQPWVRGIASLTKQFDATLSNLGVEQIDAKSGTLFDPEFHQAVQFDDATEGDREVIAEELQPGYLLNGDPIRHTMVRVTRK